MNYFIGIDPGKNGGVAVVGKNYTATYRYTEEVLQSVVTTLLWCQREYKEDHINIYCYVENVHAMPGQGVTSMFTFGKNFGYILGVLDANGIEVHLVSPQKWKNSFNLSSDKKESIALANQLFPDVSLLASKRSKKPHDGMAEALLIAEYGRRLHNDKENH